MARRNQFTQLGKLSNTREILISYVTSLIAMVIGSMKALLMIGIRYIDMQIGQMNPT